MNAILEPLGDGSVQSEGVLERKLRLRTPNIAPFQINSYRIETQGPTKWFLKFFCQEAFWIKSGPSL